MHIKSSIQAENAHMLYIHLGKKKKGNKLYGSGVVGAKVLLSMPMEMTRQLLQQA